MTGLELLLAAMVMVESGGDVNAVGDGGASVGTLQISQGYFTDAMEQLRREGKTPNYRWPGDVRDARIARSIVLAYWRRYAPDALETDDWQTLARVHNGGPRGARKTATVKYWAKVQAAMRRERP